MEGSGHNIIKTNLVIYAACNFLLSVSVVFTTVAYAVFPNIILPVPKNAQNTVEINRQMAPGIQSMNIRAGTILLP